MKCNAISVRVMVHTLVQANYLLGIRHFMVTMSPFVCPLNIFELRDFVLQSHMLHIKPTQSKELEINICNQIGKETNTQV